MKLKPKTKIKIQVTLQFIIMLTMFILLKVYDVSAVSVENTITSACIMLPSTLLIMSIWIIGDRI